MINSSDEIFTIVIKSEELKGKEKEQTVLIEG